MEFLKFSFLAIIQGLTKFLPVSSSGHLFIIQNFFHISADKPLLLWLSIANFLAVLFLFGSRIKKISQELWSMTVSFFRKRGIHVKQEKNENGILGLKLILATICTIPTALFFQKISLTFFRVRSVASLLLLSALIIVIAEQFKSDKKRNFSYLMAVFIGLVQGVSILPGLSRIGIGIAFLMLFGLEASLATEIVFLLGAPLFLGQMIELFKEKTMWEWNVSNLSFAILCLGASIFAMSYLLKHIRKKWMYFAPYCALIGIILLIFFDK